MASPLARSDVVMMLRLLQVCKYVQERKVGPAYDSIRRGAMMEDTKALPDEARM